MIGNIITFEIKLILYRKRRLQVILLLSHMKDLGYEGFRKFFYLEKLLRIFLGNKASKIETDKQKIEYVDNTNKKGQ